jgi:LysR family nod box-dependent transcriptional activator
VESIVKSGNDFRENSSMRYKRFDLNLAVVLDALLAEHSVTKAGQRLNVSQTTVSDALARMREHFQDELLTQVGKKMVPTPLGESLVAPVRGLLLQADAMLNTRPSFDPAAAVRNFTLMLSDYVATVLISSFVPLLQAAAPGITLELVPHSTVPWESLDRGDVDFLIMPSTFVHDSHPSDVLFEDGFTCIVWNGNDLVGDSVTMAQYLGLGHVINRVGRNRAPTFDEWFFKRYGHARKVEMIAMDFNSVPQFVVNTRRIATMHTHLARHYAQYLPIRLVAHDFELPALQEAIQWNRFYDTDPAVTWMRELLKATAARVIEPLQKL